jgi:hypothetical protein
VWAVVSGILGLFVFMPIAFYLQFRVLQAVEATTVMWLLFWVNMPLGLLINVISKIFESDGKKK